MSKEDIDKSMTEIWLPDGFSSDEFIPYGESPVLIMPTWDTTGATPKLVIQDSENARATQLMRMLEELYPDHDLRFRSVEAVRGSLTEYFSAVKSKSVDDVIKAVNAVNREFSSWNRYSGHDQEGAARHNADVDRWRAYAHQMQILDYIAKGFGDNNQRDRALYELILAMLPEEVMQEVIKSKRAALFNK